MPHLNPVTNLPDNLTEKSIGLAKSELNLMYAKQHQLKNPEMKLRLFQERQLRNVASEGSHRASITQATEATLVFTQEEAGTAVCISPQGLIITCSHCVAETPEEPNWEQHKWMIFASGQIIQAKCVAWDPKRDLALLQITAAQSPQAHTTSVFNRTPGTSSFPFISIAKYPPPLHTSLICIGHPGSEDLEISRLGIKTGYDVLHISTGLFHGYAFGQDLQDNSEIGALKHDCWTYWGHSGAPLVELFTGCLVGLHSSWDEDTALLEAAREL
ncbi:trypsin-like serine protease [Glonium stellatum]|uniref:Trypsin-like serine protease n=1 Tax=Glonium stellatum TaxID=574774 RepID=A0A8E2JN12_9PEZI|nr:trypsin-like serine protease [Glonium stellatum]